jgi:hypothetical protein
MAVDNGEMRKRSSSWRLWIKELKMSMALNLLWAMGLDKRKQGHLVYDIDEVEL